MGKSIKSVVKLVTAPIKAMYDPVGAFKDVFGGVQGVFAGLTGAAKISGGPSSEPSSQTVRSSKAPVRFILGRTSTGGVLAWVQEQSGDQSSGEWIHIVYVLSEGAIAGVDEIYVDERPLSDLGENATSEVIIDPTQVNTFLLANCPDWRQEQIGRGLSFVRLSFKYDAEKFPSGIPDVRFVVRGRSDIYDPRNGNSGYSANTALLILWYLRNRCAIPDDEIIFQSFASAANVCDETVIGPDGKMSPRYFAGAVIGADEKRNTVLDNLLSACAGTLIRVGGRWSLQVGAYYGPADFTINEDMVIGTVEGTTEVSNSDAINTMRGTFVDPAQAWAETDYPEVAIQDWIATDGGELAESQSFAYVTDAYLAQRLANISLRRRRSGGSLAVPLNFNGYNCRPGRAVKVDLPSLNILGEFIVTEWTMGAADACKVTLKPYEQAIFDDAVGQPYDPLGFINLPVGGLAAVTGLVWTPSGVAEVVQGVLSWAPPAQTVLSYTVTIRKGDEVVQSLKVGGEASSCNINGLTSGTYAMSVVAFGPGTRSGEATINVNVGGPPVPESCAVYASVDTITLVPNNLQNSLNGGTYEYFYATNPSAPIADAVYLGQGLTFTHTGLAFAKEYSYYVRSANAYGKSDFLYVLAATSSDPTQMLEVIAGQITESELGQELTKRIDKIDQNGPGSVNERVGQVRNELNEQITEVNNSVDSVSSSLTQARNELQQQISAVDQNVESAKTSLAQQIAVVNQAVGTAKTDLQQQINTVSVLAGSLPYNKDKTYSATQSVLGDNGMLYQALKAVPKNTPPPNATYWTDVGQAIVTAAGTATRVSKVETDVSTLDGKTTAQASQIGGLQTGLTATNQNVATAQQAADAANTLAGGKGKVIIQAAAPAAVDRLAQNLWIDTTGNANTPKRWSGSAWVAVTDKAATDAAAAAASALALAQTKADAMAVNNLTLRVSDAEGKLVAEGQRLDGLQASLDGKASSTALQEVTSRVTVAERDIVSTSSRTSALENTVNSTTSGLPSKASTAALNSVSGRVTATEQGLSSQATSVNSLTASVKAANSAGGNIVPNASFDPAYSQMGYVVLATASADVPAGCPFKYAARLASRDHYPALADVPFAAVKPGDTWRVSALVACVTGVAPFNLYIQVGTDPATIKGTGLGGGRVNTTSVWTRTSWDYTVPADVFFIRPFLQIGQVANGGTVWLATDWHMEDVSAAKTAQATADATATALSSTQATVTQQGEKLVAEGKRIDGLRVDVDSKASSSIVQSLTQRVTATEGKNGTQDQQISSQSAALLALTDTVAGKANASTVQALSNAVTQQGQDLTAAGAQLTNISASLSDAGSENLIYNPSFEKPGSAAGVADGWGYTAAGGTRNPSLPASTLAPGGVVQRIDLTGLSSSVWFRLRTATDKNVKVASGSTYTLSFYVRATAGLDVKAQINGLTSAGAASGTWQTNLSGATGEWRRLSVTFTPADTTVEVYLAVVVYGTASTSAGFIEVDNAQFERGTIPTGWRDNNSVTDAAQSATAAAVDSLTATVSQQAGALSSVSGRTTNLENSLTTTNGNVDKAQQAAQAASDLAGSKGKVLVQTAAPAAADRQVQNLWIDTTGNANTPKRWNGTSWAAVTDKVATDAAAAAQSALAEVAKKADATAVQALSSRVTANEQGLTSAAESVTNLGASIKAANSAGGNVIPNATFDPAFTRMGFTVLATTASGVPAGCPFKYAAQLTGRDHNPALADVPFVAVKPGDVWRLNALVACAAGTASFNLYIQIGSDPGTVSRTGTSGGRLAPTSTWTRTTFDYTVPAGVYFIRPFLQIDQAAGAGTVWYATDWHMEDVSAAKAAQVTADATAAALSSTQATVAQQGNKLTAETSRIDGLYASVGDANAAIQNEANARANADSALTQQIQTTQSSLGDTNASVQQISKAQTDLKGKVDTSYTVKLQAFAGGIYAAAGIALGIEKNGAVLQSTFAVMADKFAVLNATANGFVSPFSIQYGQVFLTDAFIRDGSIINAKIQDAAIDNAKIANGAITSAKIGEAEIDTLRIRGNAVTVPVSASSAGIVYGVGEGQWRDLIAIGVQMDEAGYITAQYSCYQGFGSGIRKYQFRMEINGLVIAEGGGDWADGFPNLMGSIGVGAGYFVITVKWWGENAGVSVKNHTLYAMGTKR